MTINEPSFWTQYMPHGHCYLWRADILWLNVVSDLLIALAYFSIPIALFFVLKKRPSTPYKYLIVMFSLFILACGITHTVAIWTVWNGDYGVQGIAKAVTALISVATAICLIPVLPRLASLKSPDELRVLNLELKQQIQEQRESSNKLSRAEEKLRIYLQKAPDGIILVRATGIIEYSNDMANNMFGHPPGGLTGEHITELMPNRFRDHITPEQNNVFDDELARAEFGSAEFIGIRKDNADEFPVEVSISPMHSEADYGELVLATLRNISSRKAREEQARKELLDVAHVSSLSTVGQMAAGLAHELNQPLTAISNNLHTAMSIQKAKDKPDEVLIEIMQENYESAQRAGEIIRSLRQLVSKDSGLKEPHNVNEIVLTTARLLDHEVKTSAVKLELILDDNLPLCLIDAVQVQQVMVNLGRNSIESLSSNEIGNRKIKVTAKQHDDKTLIISVEDNGPGLSPAAKASLFQPYFTSKIAGMGLGLSICKSIIEAQGGLLWLDKKFKGGALFHFTLPISEASKKPN